MKKMPRWPIEKIQTRSLHLGYLGLLPGDDLFDITSAVGDDVEEHKGVEIGGLLVAL